jgi:hypothetical protein
MRNMYDDPINANPDEIKSDLSAGRGLNKAWKDKEGRYHRDGDLPAVINKNGTMIFYQHGKFHRDGDKPAAVEIFGQIKELSWWKDGQVHRDNGPAVISSYSYGEKSIEYAKNDERLKRIIKDVNGKYVTRIGNSADGQDASLEEVEDFNKWINYLENYDEEPGGPAKVEEPKFVLPEISKPDKKDLIQDPVTKKWVSRDTDLEELRRNEEARKKREEEVWLDFTGLYPERKRAEVINKLISIANRLDDLGLHEEADLLDELLK